MPTGEKGHPGRNLPILLAINVQRQVFLHRAKQENLSYEHGYLNPPTNPFHRKGATYCPFERTEGKQEITSWPIAPRLLSEARGLQQATPGDRGSSKAGDRRPLREGQL